MTLNTSTDRTQTGGTGALIVFPFLFRIWAVANLEVIRSNKVTPLEKETLVEGTDYTVDGVNDAAGGEITLIGAHAASPPTTDENITCLRKLSFVQAVDIENQGGFKGNTHEDRFDYMMACIQQLKGSTDRALQVDEVSIANPSDLTYEDFVSGPVLLDEAVASDQLTLEVVNDSMGNYDRVELEMIGIEPAVGAKLTMRVTNDNGGSWLQAANSYKIGIHGVLVAAGAVDEDDNAETYALLTLTAAAMVASSGVYGSLILSRMSASAHSWVGQLTWMSANYCGASIYGRVLSAADLDGCQLQMSTGNIASGTLRLWGLPRSV